jgi:hypothetical protein
MSVEVMHRDDEGTPRSLEGHGLTVAAVVASVLAGER